MQTIARILHAPANQHRAAATARAIRRAQARALAIADEADMDGRPGIARALRRKVSAPTIKDIAIDQLADRVRARISAYGVTAEGIARA